MEEGDGDERKSWQRRGEESSSKSESAGWRSRHVAAVARDWWSG